MTNDSRTGDGSPRMIQDTEPSPVLTYVKVPSTGFTWNSGGVLKVVLLDSNVDPITVLEASPTADIENGWQRVQATFTVGTSGTYRPGFQLEGVSGTVYIDDVRTGDGSLS